MDEINEMLTGMGAAVAELTGRQRSQASWILNGDTLITMLTDIDDWMSSPFEAFGGAPTIFGLPVEKSDVVGWRLVIDSSERYKQQ